MPTILVYLDKSNPDVLYYVYIFHRIVCGQQLQAAYFLCPIVRFDNMYIMLHVTCTCYVM